AGAAEDVVATGETTHVTVQVEGMHFTPDVIEVPVGNALVVTFENTGTDVHDLTFANGVRSARLAPGASEVVEVGVIGADMADWSSIAGLWQRGMELEVVAIGAPEGSGPATGHEHGGDPDAPSVADDVDLAGTEPAAGFEPWPAALAPAPAETVHRLT